MIELSNEKKCCGCGACQEVCPQSCIKMNEGSLGHLFPNVDKESCINCGLCNKVCPMINDCVSEMIDQKVYAAFNKENEIRKLSSSGGMFYSIASYLIDNDYIVFGSFFDEKLKLITGAACTKEELVKLCKSKYLQSSMLGVYSQIKLLLNKGKRIAFCGTPCQVNALKLFLKKEFPNLFCIDFFCHGVPSQKYFDKCKQLIEKNKKISVKKFEYRTKVKDGCTPHYYTMVYEKNGKVKSKTDFYFTSPNYASFQSYINLRESCYDCKFAISDRKSDVTIGDFHNINKYDESINRFDGVSTLILNSKKGREVFESIKDNLIYREFDLDYLINEKEIFYGGTVRPNKRDDFIADYNSLSFDKLIKKWFRKNKYIKQRIYYRLPKYVRKILKKLGGI